MTRAQNTTIWGLALVVGAFVLGSGEDTLPLAVGAAGVVAVVGGGLVALNERDAAQLAAQKEGGSQRRRGVTRAVTGAVTAVPGILRATR